MRPSQGVPRDIEIWCPVLPTAGRRISMEHVQPKGERHCMLLTVKAARALGTRLISVAAVLDERQKRERR